LVIRKSQRDVINLGGTARVDVYASSIGLNEFSPRAASAEQGFTHWKLPRRPLAAGDDKLKVILCDQRPV
jgi:hypothetical protein